MDEKMLLRLTGYVAGLVDGVAGSDLGPPGTWLEMSPHPAADPVTVQTEGMVLRLSVVEPDGGRRDFSVTIREEQD